MEGAQTCTWHLKWALFCKQIAEFYRSQERSSFSFSMWWGFLSGFSRVMWSDYVVKGYTNCAQRMHCRGKSASSNKRPYNGYKHNECKSKIPFSQYFWHQMCGGFAFTFLTLFFLLVIQNHGFQFGRLIHAYNICWSFSTPSPHPPGCSFGVFQYM